ncbi:MAG TPA: hypothetical protein VMV44_13215 [Rectinemataceae bacterium]|nr:hypothetical protein [Rectinemataceae bacterium]
MRRTILLSILPLALFATWGQDRQVSSTDPMAAPPSAAEASPYRATYSIDWRKRVLDLDISLDFKKAGLSLPEGRLTAERMIARDLPGLAESAFFEIPVDSEGSIGARVVDGSLGVDSLLALAGKLQEVNTAFSKDLLSLRSRWELPLSEAAALFVDWKMARALSGPPGWTASRAYTGIVIYAQGELPVHGERGRLDRLHRGLFPRVLSEDMAVVMDRWVVDPRILVAQGPLAYVGARSADDEARVGDEPLLIRATGLFGSYRTDLIISDDDAARILGRAENRKLIADGRVIVVISPAKTASFGD